MFSPIFGLGLDWDRFKSPVKERPIPMRYYHRALIISAIRKPNRARDITYGDDCGFTPLGRKVKE
jgi:hypothetical protein